MIATKNSTRHHDSSGLCRYLEWDSDFFGCRIASLQPTRLDAASARIALDWCATREIECLYFLSELEPQSVAAAEAHGFRLVDVRMTLETRLASPGSAAPAAVRVVQPNDVPALRAIARASHRDTRFYSDTRFDRSRCDALYETWIERSCHGYADEVLIVDVDGRAAGYISCHASASGEGQIGLVGVDAAVRGRGIGRALLDAALSWFGGRQIAHVTVVTQGRNYAAQRLYQRSGFVTGSVQLWYHRWFGGIGDVSDEHV